MDDEERDDDGWCPLCGVDLGGPRDRDGYCDQCATAIEDLEREEGDEHG